MGFGFARVRIKGIRISEGLLYIYICFICQFCPLTVSMSGLNVSPRYRRRAPLAKWWLLKISNSKNGCRCTTQIGVKCLGCNVLMGAHSTHDKV